jgi:predicted ATPase
MKSLEILNIGPIKEVKIDLNKINVFIGEQSVGKSTIAKIISYCQWAEKRFLLDQGFNYKFSEQFINFHRIDENYFYEDSFFKYETDFVSISYRGIEHKPEIKKKNENSNFLKSKNIYIPSERNFVSTVPNLGRFTETTDNIMSFVYDWYGAKKQYLEENALPILNLNIKYHHREDTDSDILTLENDGREISLKKASSGLQSIVPLMALINYLTDGFFKKSKSNSVNEKEATSSLLQKMLDQLNHKKNEIHDLSGSDVKKILKIVNNRMIYHHTNFIIEEPEQNLFPKTQKDLIYFLLNKINSTDRNHSLTLTTHSPYVLYAINNCIMASIVSEKLSEEEKAHLKSFNSKIDPKSISVYQIKDGLVHSIQGVDGLIGENFFDEQMKEVMNDFYSMLNHY